MKKKFLLGSTIVFLTKALVWAEIATSFSLPQSPYAGGNMVNGLDGYEFVPTVDVTVIELGWYDQGGNGLLHTHPVGIYLTASQTLLRSSTVTTSSTLDPVSNFRFEPITPLILKAGTNYTLVGYGAGPSWDPYVQQPNGGVHFAPVVRFIRARSASASGLGFPTVAGTLEVLQLLFFGPNFRFADRPATVALLTPSTHVEQTNCVPARFQLSATAASGTYPTTNVSFFANATNLIGSAATAPYRATSVALPHGVHSITAVATDTHGLTGTSTQSVTIGLRWPTNLHKLYTDIATNGDFVGCMCAYSGSNYLVQSANLMQPNPDWQPYTTNLAENAILTFTVSASNRLASPQRYFRARLLP